MWGEIVFISRHCDVVWGEIVFISRHCVRLSSSYTILIWMALLRIDQPVSRKIDYPCLLMHWLLTSPEYQQTWYWLYELRLNIIVFIDGESTHPAAFQCKWMIPNANSYSCFYNILIMSMAEWHPWNEAAQTSSMSYIQGPLLSRTSLRNSPYTLITFAHNWLTIINLPNRFEICTKFKYHCRTLC